MFYIEVAGKSKMYTEGKDGKKKVYAFNTFEEADRIANVCYTRQEYKITFDHVLSKEEKQMMERYGY